MSSPKKNNFNKGIDRKQQKIFFLERFPQFFAEKKIIEKNKKRKRIYLFLFFAAFRFGAAFFFFAMNQSPLLVFYPEERRFPF